MKVVEDCGNWLSYHRVWGKLPADALQALTHSFHSLNVEPRKLIYQEGQTPSGLYLLKLGTVEIFRQSLIGQLVIRNCQPGDLFDYTLIANVPEGTYQSSAIALTKSEVLFVPKAAFDALIVKYPLIQQVIQSQLAEDLQEYSTRIARLEMRIQGLQSYLQPVPTDKSIIGKSKAAQKLTQQINQASANTEPVVLQAHTGTGKTFVAGLIHAQSALASQPFAEMDCADLTCAEDGRLNTDMLFGRVGQQMGILELLERGTLLLDNVQVLSQGDRYSTIFHICC